MGRHSSLGYPRTQGRRRLRVAVLSLLASFGVIVAVAVSSSAAQPPTHAMAGQRMVSCRTDADGMCAVRHRHGVVPASVEVTPRIPKHHEPYRLSVVPGSETAERFRVLAVREGGQPYADERIRFSYRLAGERAAITTTSAPEPITPTTTTAPATTTTTTTTRTRTATPTTTPPPATTTSSPPSGATTGQVCTNPRYTWQTHDGGGPLDGAGHGDGKDYYGMPNVWSDNGQITETMGVCSFHSWYVDVTASNGTGAVLSYPNMHKDWHDWGTGAEPAVNSFNTIPTQFAATTPGNVGAWNAGYDAWFNGVADSDSTELMIWNRWHNRGMGGFAERVGTVTLDGHGWGVYATSDRQYVAFVAEQQFDSGKLDIKHFTDYMVAHDLLPANSTLGAIDYGIEIVSTGGQKLRFDVTNFQVDAY